MAKEFLLSPAGIIVSIMLAVLIVFMGFFGFWWKRRVDQQHKDDEQGTHIDAVTLSESIDSSSDGMVKGSLPGDQGLFSFEFDTTDTTPFPELRYKDSQNLPFFNSIQAEGDNQYVVKQIDTEKYPDNWSHESILAPFGVSLRYDESSGNIEYSISPASPEDRVWALMCLAFYSSPACTSEYTYTLFENLREDIEQQMMILENESKVAFFTHNSFIQIAFKQDTVIFELKPYTNMEVDYTNRDPAYYQLLFNQQHAIFTPQGGEHLVIYITGPFHEVSKRTRKLAHYSSITFRSRPNVVNMDASTFEQKCLEMFGVTKDQEVTVTEKPGNNYEFTMSYQ